MVKKGKTRKKVQIGLIITSCFLFLKCSLHNYTSKKKTKVKQICGELRVLSFIKSKHSPTEGLRVSMPGI